MSVRLSEEIVVAGLAPNQGSDSASDEKRFAGWLFVAVFASRAFTSSSAYFGDANRHITAVQNRTYVIEPPGYWLFNRTAGLFPVFYCAWRPMAFPNHSLQAAEHVIDAYAGEFSYYGVQHHYAPRLSWLLHRQGYGEPGPRPGKEQ